ncbi:hypothetical protein D3C75_923840 [compost metagenome]|nr:hypothetical protein [Pseudomonas sp.]
MRGLSVLMLGLVFVLAGCSVRVPGVSADVGDGVHVDIGGGGDGHGGGRFCPPGQAKKGNC